jgi:type IV secretion system protein VirD4
VTKTKLKITLFLFLSVIGLIIGFFFAGYVNLLLSGGNIDDISTLRPTVIMASIAENERHRMLTLCVEILIVAGIAALMLMSRRETFESDTSAIAGTINTPVALGQGQHGTARWLKKSERQKAFAAYRLDVSERKFAALLDAGALDRKEVKAHGDKNSGSDTAAADTKTAELVKAPENETPGTGE